MLRPFSLCLIATVSAMFALANAANADGSYTTRIETHPYYGAVTTIEHGVRVIRPLPPVRQVIINPNRTPLSLEYNETHVYEQGGNGYGNAIVRRQNLGAYNEDGPIYTYPAYGRRYWFGHNGHGGHGHLGHGGKGPRINGFSAVPHTGGIGAH